MTQATQESPLLGYVSLFTSVGTLLCCALPSLLVLLGLGATVGAVLSSAPWLVTLSRHKQWVFLVSGLLIAGNFVYLYKLAPKLRAQGVFACLTRRRPATLRTASAGMFCGSQPAFTA